ncbi:MAG: ECF transporter S component [Tissierellia bacterium]|nr:ECF transporter S component [Tissierellia bacterium]
MNLKTRKLTLIAVLSAIIFVMGISPLGFIPLGVLNITTMHIPVIVAGILEGPLVGGLVGFIFGLFSMFNAIVRPNPLSFIFLNPLVSVGPRILIGVFTAYVYRIFKNKDDNRLKIIMNLFWGLISLFMVYMVYRSFNESASTANKIFSILFLILALLMLYLSIRYRRKDFALAISAFVGTLTNSGLVLTLIYLIYADKYVMALGISRDLAAKVIFSAFVTNGIPEAIIAIMISSSVVYSILKRRR